MPADVATLPKLYTTACPEAKAMIADWRDLLFGVRKSITVRVLQESFLGSNLQIAVLAYARVDFAGTRAAVYGRAPELVRFPPLPSVSHGDTMRHD